MPGTPGVRQDVRCARRGPRRVRAPLSPALAALAVLLQACVTAPDARHYALFEPVGADDVFVPAISSWQAENRLEELADEVAVLRRRLAEHGASRTPAESSADAVSDPSGESALGVAYAGFRSHLRRGVVNDTVRWVQQQSGLYYRPDSRGDDWPVLAELLDRGADDCDGMDLLTFSLLRRLGFEPGEIYRTILRNRADDRYHIVTLWFEPGHRDDPWLLDSTGEVSETVRPLSEHPDWEPLRLFDETRSYAVRAR
ncbi:MAG: hypothetical protein JRG82_01075 [Deltaproteobacteria bacterium]|nr:hypothetical protein [Deltaproteobacteria bacterium]